MTADAVDMQPGTQYATSASDHVVRARVPNHHAVDPARSAGAFEVGFRAAEAARVLVDVEQQHHAAREAACFLLETGSNVGEYRRPRLGIR